MKEGLRSWVVAYAITLGCFVLVAPIAALASWMPAPWGWVVVLVGIPLLFPFIWWTTDPERAWNRVGRR